MQVATQKQTVIRGGSRKKGRKCAPATHVPRPLNLKSEILVLLA